jgi:membrane protein implicated in regulation of membrane protease activity
MVKLTPRIKFVVITVNELLVIPVVIFLAYYFVPELLPFTILVSIPGGIIFVIIKYRLVYDSLKDDTNYLYSPEGTKCTVIETITSKSGKVRFGAEIWEARTDSGEIPPRTKVVIVSRENFEVRVKPWPNDPNQ